MQNTDFYDALMDGRWQPEIHHRTQVREKTGETVYVASYQQGEQVVERESPYSVSDAEALLHDELRRGTLEGEYYPIIG